jgi:hypothetical protein
VFVALLYVIFGTLQFCGNMMGGFPLRPQAAKKRWCGAPKSSFSVYKYFPGILLGSIAQFPCAAMILTISGCGWVENAGLLGQGGDCGLCDNYFPGNSLVYGMVPI